MLRQVPVHLEHRHLVFAKDGLELVISQNLAPVLRVLKPTTAANSLDGCSGFCRAGFAFLVPLAEEAPLAFDVLLGILPSSARDAPRCREPSVETPDRANAARASIQRQSGCFVTMLAERAILTPERARRPYNIGCPPVTGTTAPDM